MDFDSDSDLDDHVNAESAPLLGDQNHDSPFPSTLAASSSTLTPLSPTLTPSSSILLPLEDSSLPPKWQPPTRTILPLLSLLLFLVVTSGLLILAPIFRLIEDKACHIHYRLPPSEPIDERLCKIDEVQGPLAYLGGLSVLLAGVLNMVAALPYGLLADRVGRKKAFGLAYLGVIMAFAWAPAVLWFGSGLLVGENQLWVLMVGSVFFLVGGGVPMLFNVLNAMAADVSGEGDK